VQWEGYPVSEATWESEANLQNAPLKVQEFHRKNPKAINPHKIGKSIFTTSEFLEFQKNFIRPYIAFGNSQDARPRRGVMSQMPRSNPKFNPITPTIPLASTTCITHVEDNNEEVFYDCD
jgi:hypothetical protein